jgi:Tol biopolymer transport system component
MKFLRPSHALFPRSRSYRQGPRPSRIVRPALGLERFEERTLLSTALVSVNSLGTAAGNSASDFHDTSIERYSPGALAQSTQGNISADGSRLVFSSDATDLVPSANDTNQSTDVFVREMTAGQTSLVSATPGGNPGNGPSFDPVISPNGRYVAFVSLATNLTGVAAQSAGPSQGQAAGNLYVRDLLTQTTTLLDQTPDGQASDGLSTGQFVFSPDSTTLAFVDTSDDLTNAPVETGSGSIPGLGGLPPGVVPSPAYVYVRDLAGNSTSLVSISTDGKASGTSPELAAIPTDLVFSPDSRSLVYGSAATDLTANLPDNAPNPDPLVSLPPGSNLFLYDLPSRTTTLLSVTANGRLAGASSSGAVFSPDGRSVAFSSAASDLTANAVDPTPSPGSAALGMGEITSNIFIRNLDTGTTTLVSATPQSLQSNGTSLPSNGNSAAIAFSPDGGSLAYLSDATDLTNNPLDPTPAPGALQSAIDGSFPVVNDNVFITDLRTGATTLVSVTPGGDLSSGNPSQIVFSPDGRLLAFVSSAGDLTGNGFEATPPSIPAAPSSAASPIPAGVSNVFVRDLAAHQTTLVSVTTSGQLPNANAAGPIFSPDSKSLFFMSTAVDLTSNPPDTATAPGTLAGGPSALSISSLNLFVRDLSAGTTSLLSTTTGGKLSQNSLSSTLLAPNGQTLYFDSSVDNLAAGDTNRSADIFAASAPFAVPNQFRFTAWESAARESGGQVQVTVLRTAPATAAATVDYAVQNGSAQAGTDFKATAGTLKFAAGQTAATFTVPLFTGDHFTGTRSASLVLSNPQGASLGYPSAELDLTADPAQPSPAPVAPAHPSAAAPGPTVLNVKVSNGRRGLTSLAITFDQALNPASALNAANYRVSLPALALRTGRGRPTVTRPGHSLAISHAQYDPATNQVTLTLHKHLSRGKTYQLQISGASGGVTGAAGTPLYSPDKLKPGRDYLAALTAGPVALHG